MIDLNCEDRSEVVSRPLLLVVIVIKLDLVVVYLDGVKHPESH